MRTRTEEQYFRRTSALIEKSIKEVGKDKMLLTREIVLPVGEALPDVLCLEFFSGRAVLTICL